MWRLCSSCGLNLELDESNFYRNKTKKDGFNYTCKRCVAKTDRERYPNVNDDKYRRTRRALYALAYRLHRTPETWEALADIDQLTDRHYEPQDGSEFIHWLLSPDCGRLCAAAAGVFNFVRG